MDGLLTSLHLKLDHPTHNQLKLVTHRYFFALDLDSALDRASISCHTCAALSKLSHHRIEQSSSDPPASICSQFAADVIRRERQFIFALREVVSSYTWTTLIVNEQAESLRDALVRLCIPVRPIDGPATVIRVDTAPGFKALRNDKVLENHSLSLDFGRTKNPNKNPVAERTVQELEAELLKHDPRGGPVSDLTLATCTARLNSRIRTRGLSSREMLFQRDQFNNNQLPIADWDLIKQQHQSKLANHHHSEASKAPLSDYPEVPSISVGDLVYLHNDRSKLKARERYLVVRTDEDWVYIRKFAGNQLRQASYKVKRSECYKVPSSTPSPTPVLESDEDYESPSSDIQPFDSSVALAEPSLDHQGTTELDACAPVAPDVIVPVHPPPLVAAPPELEASVAENVCTTPPEVVSSGRPQRTRTAPDRLSVNWKAQSYV